MIKLGLHVPMKLDALVVNDYVRQHQPFRRHKMNYSNLDNFESPEPSPFENLEEAFRDDSSNDGIYVHWDLPSGFTQVTQVREDSNISYPLIPNRWLVIRKQHGMDNTSYDAAWVVISDKTWKESMSGSPFRTYRVDEGTINFIGDKKKLSEWHEQRNQAELFLTADGCGDFSFAAFQPSNQNVLSIHDNLEGLPKGLEVDLDYTVLGWFSNPSDDPLHNVRSQDQFETVLARYKWKNSTTEVFPWRTLLKGKIEKVRWVEGRDPARLPRADHPNRTVTVGLTSTDAICELIGNFHNSGSSQADSQLMEVFLYGQLQEFEKIGGDETLDDVIHSSGFVSSRGGLIWKLSQRKESTETGTSSNHIEKDESLESKEVVKLNVLQREMDTICREVLTRQQQLYESWWKYKKNCRLGDCEEYNELFKIAQQVFKLLRNRNGLIGRRNDMVKMIQDYLKHTDSKNELICEDMPRFWSPNDPVIMISGFNKQANSPARTDTECLLFEFSESFTESDADNLPEFVSAALRLPVPDDMKQTWEQPWKPLFLEWEVEWKPIPYTRANWKFDGRELQCSSKSTSGIIQTFSGRTLLGAHAIFSIKDRLQKYVCHHPQPETIPQELKDFISGMEEWDVLSQALSGLNQQFLQRDPRMHPLPDERSDVTPLLEYQSNAMPFKDSISENSEDSLFQPIRCGHLALKRLAIVDVFGQVEDIGITPEATFISESFRTADELPGIAELKPRIVQGARLNFHWVSSQRDQEEVNFAPSVNPVCGWVIPNHLDRGLAVYDPNGRILGEIILNGRLESSPTAVWEPAPEVMSISNSYWSAKNQHLKRFIHGLTHAPDKGEALSSLLPTIDETLWVINPKERSFDKSLSVLIGRPLVMARAKLSLELEGAYLFHPKFFPLDSHLPSYITKQIKVKLGNVFSLDDGLIGYYLNDDYHKFYSVYRPSQAKSPYVEEISPNNYIKLNLKNEPIYVTLLFDPNASISAYSDIVPAKGLNLPQKFHTKALQQMEVFFRTGPILTSVLDRAPETNRIILPTPHLTKGEWTWYERNRSDYERWDSLIPLDEDQKELPSREAPTLREGLLKLKLSDTQSSTGP